MLTDHILLSESQAQAQENWSPFKHAMTDGKLDFGLKNFDRSNLSLAKSSSV